MPDVVILIIIIQVSHLTFSIDSIVIPRTVGLLIKIWDKEGLAVRSTLTWKYSKGSRYFLSGDGIFRDIPFLF